MRVPKGCPLCEGDVLGTIKTGFYCKACNLLFRKRHIFFSEFRIQTKRLINQHFSGFEQREPLIEEVKKQEILLGDESKSDFLDRLSKNLHESMRTLEEQAPRVQEATKEMRASDFIELEVEDIAEPGLDYESVPIQMPTAAKDILEEVKKPAKKKPKKNVAKKPVKAAKKNVTKKTAKKSVKKTTKKQSSKKPKKKTAKKKAVKKTGKKPAKSAQNVKKRVKKSKKQPGTKKRPVVKKTTKTGKKAAPEKTQEDSRTSDLENLLR